MGDTAAAARSLVDSGLLVISENEQTAVIVAVWGSPVARLAAVGRIANEFDRLPIPSQASAVFRGFVLPEMSGFATARLGLGEPRLGELAQKLREGEFDRSDTVVDIVRRPGVLLRARHGELGLWGAVNFESEEATQAALERLRGNGPGRWLMGDTFEFLTLVGWPESEGVADLRFTSAARLATGKEFKTWSHGSSGLPEAQGFDEQFELWARAWETIRDLADPMQRQVLGLERPLGAIYSGSDHGLVWAEVRGRTGARHIGELAARRFGLEMTLELESRADLRQSERLGALHFSTGGPSNPVGSVLAETHKLMNGFNHAQRVPAGLRLPSDPEALRALLADAQRLRRADAQHLIDTGLLPDAGLPLDRQTYIIINIARGASDPFQQGLYSVSFHEPGDSTIELVIVDNLEERPGLFGSPLFNQFFDLPDAQPGSSSASVLRTGLAERLSRSEVRLPDEWMTRW